MPIPQTRIRDLLNAAMALKRMLDEMKAFADRTLSTDGGVDGTALALMISETKIPDSVIEVLASEREHQRLTWKRNQANAASLRKRRRDKTDARPSALNWAEEGE